MAAKLLQNTYKKCLTEPVQGIVVELSGDSLFDWIIWMEGPEDSPYEGGVFKLEMSFPDDYPMSPPKLQFLSVFWHPNVYSKSGEVCISILHPPGEDETSGEAASERWLPTRTVTAVLMSVSSMLHSPNLSSPANVDAGVEWRDTPDKYKERVAHLVKKANREKPASLKIPHPDTDPAERKKQIQANRREVGIVDDAEAVDFLHDYPDDFLPDENLDSDEFLEAFQQDDDEEEEEEGSAGDREGESELQKRGLKEEAEEDISDSKKKRGKKKRKTTTLTHGKASHRKKTKTKRLNENQDVARETAFETRGGRNRRRRKHHCITM